MNVTILYGSATGNAEHIAKDLGNTINESKSSSAFRSADVMELNNFKRKKLMEAWVQPPTDAGDGVKKHALIVVCSTTGNGDAPENAGRFVRYIKKPPPATLTSSLPNPSSPLEHVAYAVLGLGDTNYDQFCESAVLIDKKLNKWGAKRSMKVTCADEGTGLEQTVEPWLEGVLGVLEKACKEGGGEKKEEKKKKEEVGDKVLSEELDSKLTVSAKKEEVEKTDIPKPVTATPTTINPTTATTNTTSGGSPAKEVEKPASTTATAKATTSSTAAATSKSTNTPATTETTTNTPPSTTETTTTNSTPTTAAPTKSATPLYVLYGSATGNSEQIAKDITATYEGYLKNPSFLGYFPSVVCCELNQYKKKCLDAWSKQPCEGNPNVKHGVIIVCSTTGNAESPENSDRFVRWMKRRTTEPTQPFQHCAYAVLGLGDTNYDVFCAMGNGIDKRLKQLGGTRAIKAAEADEGTGLEKTVEPWVGSVVGKLTIVCKGEGAVNESVKTSVVKPAPPVVVATVEAAPPVVVATVPTTAVPESATVEAAPPVVVATATTTAAPESATVEATPSVVVATATTTAAPEPAPATVSPAVVPATTVIVTPESATAAPPKMKIKQSSSSSGEEKKMEAEEIAIAPITEIIPNNGASTIRKLLSLPANSPLPSIENSSLPKMVSSHSSCELITSETRRSRGDSLWAENMSVSSGSSGFLYTAAKPYESTVLDARYLTNTSEECAGKVAGEVLLGDNCDGDESLIKAMKLYQEKFPLSSTTSAEKQQQLQYDKNGKRVMEMTLSLPDDFTLEYEPGDSVGLIVPNSPQSIQFILSMLERAHGILPSQQISVDAAHPITVEEAIRSTVDLCSTMKKKRLFLLSMYATDAEEERALRLLSSSSGNGKDVQEVDLFQQYVEDQRRSVVDILKEFPSCQSITLEGLLGCLPAIPPRYYSVCSSPLHDQQSQTSGDGAFHLKVAFSVVDYLTPSMSKDDNSGRRMAGLATHRLECICSPFLSNTNQASTVAAPPKLPMVKIFPKPSHEFRLPSNMSTPLILIGPGTGIAPFIGFLSHRQAQMASLDSTQAAEMTSEGTWRGGYELAPEDLALSRGDARGLNLAVDYMSKHQKVGDIDLFFGCRHEDHDYLYRKELEEFKARGILTNLYAAFSREEGQEKMYVQTLMQKDVECGKRLVEMILEKEASVYICGDGNAMGRDVQETIVSLLTKHFCDKEENKSLEESRAMAVAHVDQMKTFGRFVLDIWS